MYKTEAVLLLSFGVGYLFWFSSLIALARIYSTVSDESGHPYLVPNLRRKVFNFPLLSMILAVDLSLMAFINIVSADKVSVFHSLGHFEETGKCRGFSSEQNWKLICHGI